ncbi:MAG: L-lactate dehydrogenase [Eubacteriales bacterium]|nr:L-lactate dehydrogenase [Eubacteriales bacterium]
MKYRKKVVLIGAGMVGMSFAYSALNQNLCDELVIVDIDKKRAMGEAMDLNHGLSFSHSAMRIYEGEYSDCGDADIVVICAGVNQKPGESRLELLERNAKVFESIVGPVLKSGFEGIFLVATNPVDIMARVTLELSHFPPEKVIGSGTTLDTARLRYLLGRYFSLDSRNVHAYVIGEHGDSEFVPWSQALLATKPVEDVLKTDPEKFSLEELHKISEEVRSAAQKIISAKGATYYGIGMAISRIVRAILRDEQSVLTVSSQLNGEYGQRGVYAGSPCIVSHKGIDRTIELSLTREELIKMQNSCKLLDSTFLSLKMP